MTKTKSCLDCPSYLAEAETVAFFGKSLGAPACARFGNILAKPNASGDEAIRTARLTAQHCPDYGQTRPFAPLANTAHLVVLPDGDARSELSDLDVMKTNVRSCTMCVKFVPDTTVQAELGYTAGLCRAKGSLIPSNKRVDSARGCSFRAFGQNDSNTTLDLPMLPALVDPQATRTPIDDFMELSVTEPLEYVSDLVVSPEDAENGIKAWRKISDPDEYGDDVYLPIFDPDSFDKDELDYIPKTGDDAHPELYLDHGGRLYHIAAMWTEMDETPTLWGQPGVGKSELMRHFAWLMQAPFYRFPINEATELDELAGRMNYSAELGTHFVEGRLTRAWPRRSVILVDEPNTGRPEVWTFLRPLLDGTRELYLDMDSPPRQVKRGSHTYLGLAMNPAWSPLNVGTAVIGAADASRLMHVEMNLPPEHIERQIIANRVSLDGWIIDQPRLDFVMKVSGLLRSLCDDGTLSMTWGVRESIKVARALRWFNPLVAYSMAGADYLEPPQREAFMDQVRASIPVKKFDPIKEISDNS